MKNIDLNINPPTIPGFVLWQVSKLWQRHLAAALKPFGIGSTEFVVLGNAVRLAQLGQDVTPMMLVAATKIDRMTASQTMRSLEKKGLIERRDLPDDKRTFHVVPTHKGEQLADNALGKVIEAHLKFFEPLQEQTEQYLAIMQKLLKENDDEGVA
jgi:MarR family transcriptional regulator for hemolysin